MKRRCLRISQVILLSCLLLWSSGGRKAQAFWTLGQDSESSRVVVVFVDMSGSTNSARRTVYREAFAKIYQNVRQGDRIIVGTITSHSYVDFKPVVDLEIPKKSIWVNRLAFEQSLAKSKSDLQKAVEGLLSRKEGTPRTEILNSLNIADTIFHEEKRNKVLVILSDMVQDSKEYNFDRVELTDAYIAEVVRQRKEKSLIPDLTGVKVYVAGASADEAQKFRSIEKFWDRYFEAAGADFSPHRYGHSLLDFEKGA
jgi:hypothetical protein